MCFHQNARLTPSGRERLVRLARSGLAPKAVAETMGVCAKTVRKGMARFAAEGAAGLQDRPSRPHSLHRPIPAETQAAIVSLRRQRLTRQQIARKLRRVSWRLQLFRGWSHDEATRTVFP
ncbi:hypothetical protein GCM10007887_23960 [Methylobacterium haplocladii]|uniref:Uncharacterized protein n=1 Tax=Methylobacterium haplocladii TaxID=1176176 RepID=A0A512IVJ8_9HYPH|nr:hypothetical protein MHA02_41270 [Methylobacterium haplocladii]GJD83558.1 hypothetical protein HPGCJGGD_1427 [Methylobacterium haplocladii]GLS59725.1 hypothetical protein GCM10007887_23960 [Methylobacterium haplocladii]